jgi:outer membrane receptor protein involved in Fe transport
MTHFFRTSILLLFLLPTLLTAQPRVGTDLPPGEQKFIVRGKVVDAETKLPLEFATVTLFNQSDSSLATGNITDEAGAFMIETRPGRYFAKVEFLSYQTKTIGNIDLNRDEPVADLGTIALASDASMLIEVEVRAEKSQMQLSLDKKVFNVGKDLANTGGTAADVLDNVPSVTVDVEGNVNLRGSGNVRILVDGKPSGLIGISNTNGLRQLPANLIDRVEVITNPSARYEAEGMAGIINIVLKKDQQKGLNGSFDLTLGQPAEYGGSVNLNYRKNRFNFFTNYGLRYRKGPGMGSQYQESYTPDTTFITDQSREHEQGGWSNNIRFGADYFFNPKNILTTAFNYRWSNEDNFSEIEYRDYLNNLDNPTGSTIRTDKEKEKEPNLEYALTYRKTFDREGREFTADLRFQDNNEEENSDFREQYFNPDGSPAGIADLLQRSNNKEGERNVIVQSDYVHPFGSNGKFEAGLRSGLRDIRNDYLVEEFSDDAWETLTGLSNNFLYDENIHAAYAIFGNKVSRFSYQLGLRLEQSDVKTELLQTNEINDRQYTNLFPSAHVTYDLPAQNAVQVSYSRRVRRPRFWDLNPFFTFSDARNFFSGNPDLDPEFTDSYEMGHIKYWEKGSLTSSVYYRRTTGVIERIRTQTSNTTFNTFPVNLSTQDDYGLEFTWSFDPFKAWRLNGNVNFFRSITDGKYEEQDFDADTYTWFGRLSSRLTLWKQVDFQANFNYRAPRKTTQGEQKAMYHLDLGFSKEVLKNNGTLTLSVRDLFNTRRRRFTTIDDDFFTEGDHQWRARQVSLTLSYRINQKKQKGKNGRGEGEFDGGEGGEF